MVVEEVWPELEVEVWFCGGERHEEGGEEEGEDYGSGERSSAKAGEVHCCLGCGFREVEVLKCGYGC